MREAYFVLNKENLVYIHKKQNFEFPLTFFFFNLKSFEKSLIFLILWLPAWFVWYIDPTLIKYQTHSHSFPIYILYSTHALLFFASLTLFNVKAHARVFRISSRFLYDVDDDMMDKLSHLLPFNRVREITKLEFTS